MPLFMRRIISHYLTSLSEISEQQKMDRFGALRVFSRLVEHCSFTLAAEDIGLPRSTVTDALKQLEARLGVRLLQRTTRHVSPTLDGEGYCQRCLRILSDIEDAEGAFTGTKPKGLLRVDVHGTLAPISYCRTAVFPGDLSGVELYVTESLGPIQVPRERPLKSGELVHVLKDFPPTKTPVSMLYPRSRQLSPRVRVFIDWLVRVFARQTEVESGAG
ncbi:LysR family transcriptional regulator [Rhizobium mayense]|uniref:LysR family transcriptional regulator n=1 Tax=Rhizobium mayense TaxID=1312184 RepID=A0ABT7JWP9_9HYPH|nr:LysR family transcriptional regulator [Rhizobium mayense]MDL2400770.1 LysR family transcriptional regulator [Rhizobium mayense]